MDASNRHTVTEDAAAVPFSTYGAKKWASTGAPSNVCAAAEMIVVPVASVVDTTLTADVIWS